MNSKRINRLILCVLTVIMVVSTGCIKNIQTSSGEEVKLSIYLNKANPDELSKQQMYYRKQIDFWIKPELVSYFKKGRFNASLIKDRDKFVPGPGNFLLVVTIVDYTYSKKGRSSVANNTMTNRYELIGEKGEVVLTYEDTAKSIKEWKSCAKRLNRLAYGKVRDHFKLK